jgi:hypothetical protein
MIPRDRILFLDIISNREIASTLACTDVFNSPSSVVYISAPEPKIPPLPTLMFESKKRGEYVGRHGDMPIPSGKRKKFKPSRQRGK